MKIKINEDGCLELERKGYMRLQHCPFHHNSVQIKCCGDWCPMFSEPFYSDKVKFQNQKDSLTICNHRLEGEITDERT